MKQVVVGGILASYEEINPQGKRVLLILHGWGQSASMWENVAKEFNDQVRIILLDLPGFGGTQLLSSTPNVPEYAAFVTSFLEKMEMQKVWILGHSFGGQVAAKIAIDSPTLVLGLILVSPAVVRLRSFGERIKLLIFRQFSILKRILPRFVVETLLSLVTATDYYAEPSDRREVLKKIVNYDLSKQLHSIGSPTLLLWGSNDTALPYRGKMILTLIKQCELKVLYGEPHDVHVTNPALVVSEVGRWWRRLEGN